MATTTASWKLLLEDEMSGAANTAAEALNGLEKEISQSTKELQGMQKAMRNLKLSATPNTVEIDKLKARIAATKETIATAQQSYSDLGGKFEKTRKSGKSLEQRMAALNKSAKDLPGPLGDLFKGFDKLRNLLGVGSIAAGMLAIAAAATAMTIAAGVAARALYKYAIAQADAHRSEMLRLEGLSKLGNAKGMMAAIDEVSAKTPLARAQVTKYAEQLDALQLQGAALTTVLEAVAIASAVQGDEAAKALVEQAGAATKAGRSVDGLAAKVKNELGGTAKKMMASLTVQTMKQEEAQQALFSGLGMDRYDAAWKRVNDVTSQATESGRALKLVMTGILQPFVDASASGAPIIRQFFEGMIIAALDLTIVLLRLRLWWRRTFGSPEQKKAMDDSVGWLYAGEVALYALLGVLGLASIAVLGLSIQLTRYLVPALWRSSLAMLRFAGKPFAAVGNGLLAVAKGTGRAVLAMGRFTLSAIAAAARGAVAFGAALGRMALQALAAIPAMWGVVAPLLPFLAAALAVGWAVYTLIKYWDDLVLAFEQLDLFDAGVKMLDGLIEALSPTKLVAHMFSLGASAIAAFKKVLGIASPSKVFAQVGLAIPQGLTAGVEKGTPAAQSAVTSMVDVPPVPAPGAAGGALAEGASAARAAGGVSVTIGQVVVNSNASDAKSLAADFRRELESVLEGLAHELGARPGGSMTWNPLDEPADKLRLAQHWSPGLCDISGANSPREWEQRKGYGTSGATIVFKGIGLAHFSVKFRLYTATDWEEWSAFKPLVDKPPSGEKPRALDIWHPLLVDQGIYSAGVEDLGQPEQTDDGEWTIEVKFVEYRPPKPALAKPAGAAATPTDPISAAAAMIKERAKKVADLLAKLGEL